MLSWRLDEIVSTKKAVLEKVKHGTASQAWRDLDLWDNRLSLANDWMYAAKLCARKAYQSGNVNARMPQQQCNLKRKHCASKQTGSDTY